MKDIRKKKLEATILKEVSRLIIRERVREDRLGLVSVTRVNLAPDISTLIVFVSPFADEKENAATWKTLQRLAPQFQSQVAKNLRLRQTPRLEFRLDDSIKEGDRLLGMIEDE